jgi:hypothetical protein
MAPNRKQLALALDPLVNTVPLVQAKYLPLTAQEVSAAPCVPAQPTVVRSGVNSDDYWYQRHCPEPSKDLFSANHLVSNLNRDVERRSQSATPIIRASAPSSSDYWAERVQAHIVHNSANAAVSESTGYWEWPQVASTVQIALILKEEFARNLVSAEAIEARLVRDAQSTKAESQAKPEHDDYWTWQEPATVVHADSKAYWEWTCDAKQQLIDAIVAEEQVRSMLSADHIQTNLEKQAAVAVPVSAPLLEANDAYWCWPAEEDDYWNERPLSLVQRAEAMPVHGYWQW